MSMSTLFFFFLNFEFKNLITIFLIINGGEWAPTFAQIYSILMDVFVLTL